MKTSTISCGRTALVATAVCCALGSAAANAQTAFGSSTIIVIPLVANTATVTSHVTVYNPNAADVTVALNYFEANNSPSKVPGVNPSCNDVIVPPNTSVAIDLPTQCTLGSGARFGQLMLSDSEGTNPIFAYSRMENLQSIGLSTEGFPSTNFSTTTTNVGGLKRSSVAPGYQTNCFVSSQAGVVSYDLKLFDGTSGAQLGNTLSGNLNAFEQYRYLDVFAAAAVSEAELSNVRAEFTRTSVDTQQLIGFCTVQDNSSLGADFRIAKSDPPVEVPPPPAETVVSTVSWNGAMGSLDSVSSYMFVGPTAAVHLDASGNIYAGASGTFAQNPNNPVDVNINVCYQSVVGGLPTGTVNALGTDVPVHVTQSPSSATAVGSANVSAGDYRVGLCGIGTGPVNKNGNAAGFAVVTQ